MYRNRIILMVALLLLISGLVNAEQVWKYNKREKSISLNSIQQKNDFQYFPIAYYYDEYSQKISYFDNHGNARNVLAIPSDHIVRISDSGNIVYLQKNISASYCGIEVPVQIMDDNGTILFKGKYSLNAFKKLNFIDNENVFFLPGFNSSPTSFLNRDLEKIAELNFILYNYEYLEPNGQFICIASDIESLINRLTPEGNDNYILCFDASGIILWKHKINNAKILYSFKLQSNANIIDIVFQNSENNIIFLSYDTNGKEIIRKPISNMDNFYISSVVNNRFATFSDGSITIYNYPEMSINKKYSTGNFKNVYNGEIYQYEDLKITKSNEIALKYYDFDNKCYRIVMFNELGELIFNVGELKLDYNRWNGKIITGERTYICYESANNVLIEELQ